MLCLRIQSVSIDSGASGITSSTNRHAPTIRMRSSIVRIGSLCPFTVSSEWIPTEEGVAQRPRLLEELRMAVVEEVGNHVDVDTRHASTLKSPSIAASSIDAPMLATRKISSRSFF